MASDSATKLASQQSIKAYVDNQTIAAHSDTSATGAELDTLTDNSIANTLHRHSELVASDGAPDPALSVDASGNVGIGTASPGTEFHISGDGFVEQYIDAATNTSYLRPNLVFRRTQGTIASKSIVADANYLGTIQFSGYDGADWANAASIVALVDGTPGADDMPGRLEFHTSPDGSDFAVVRMTIKNDGNVGINETSPTAKLHIDSDVLRLEDPKTPASAGAAGNAGDICWDASYMYVCTATNTWKRAGIATW